MRELDEKFIEFLNSILESIDDKESKRIINTIHDGYTAILEAERGRPKSSGEYVAGSKILGGKMSGLSAGPRMDNSAHNQNPWFAMHVDGGYQDGVLARIGKNYGIKANAMLQRVMNGTSRSDFAAAKDLKRLIDEFQSKTGYIFNVDVDERNPEKIIKLTWAYDMYQTNDGDIYARNPEGKIEVIGEQFVPNNPQESDSLYAEKGDEVLDDKTNGNVASKFITFWNNTVSKEALEFLDEIVYYKWLNQSGRNNEGLIDFEGTPEGDLKLFNLFAKDRNLELHMKSLQDKYDKEGKGEKVSTEEPEIRRTVPTIKAKPEDYNSKAINTYKVVGANDESDAIKNLLKLTETYKSSKKLPFDSLPKILANTSRDEREQGGIRKEVIEGAKRDLSDIIDGLTSPVLRGSISEMNSTPVTDLGPVMQEVLNEFGSKISFFKKQGNEFTPNSTNTTMKSIFDKLKEYDPDIEYDRGRTWKAVRNNLNTLLNEFVGNGEVDENGNFKGNGILGNYYNSLQNAQVE